MGHCETMLLILLINGFLLFRRGSSAPTADNAQSSNPQDTCFLPLGMEHGHIKDEDITASSAFDFKSVGPQNARLGKDIFGGAWCPKEVIEQGVREWIEINLHREYRLTRTATQGRFGGGQGQEYAEAFILEYWRPSVGKWMTYKNHSGHSVLRGNTNTYVANVNVLTPSIVASKVRFVPYSQHPRTVCMRVEVFGCRYEDAIVSYSAPAGDEFAPNFFLEDIYDGEEDERDGSLKNGLGLLTDGLFGESVLLTDSRLAQPSAHGWVGWASRDGKPPVTLIFEFKTVREFDHVTMTSYAAVASGIQPFTQMLAYFSMEGKKFHPRYVKTVNKLNASAIEGPVNITQKLDGRLGKFVKLELYFENKWMLLSEVRFSSRESDKKNFTDNDMIEMRVDETVVNVDKAGQEVDNERKESSVLSDTPRNVDINNVENSVEQKGRKESNNINNTSAKQQTNSDTNQIYVGLVIGVLSVTVLLLLVTIIVMMRRNKQKIFNKHSAMFKSPLGGGLGATSVGLGGLTHDRHMLRDMTPLNHGAGPGAKLYVDSDHEESNSIYHEPYRLVLQRNGNNYRNSSCGRLCDYEDLGLLGTEQKGKFGSTPLFSLPPAPPTTTSTNSSNGSGSGNGTSRCVGRFAGPTSYSCQEVKNGYAIPAGMSMATMTPGRHHNNNTMMKAITPSHENFYAATDIVLKNDSVMHSPPQRKLITQPPRASSPGTSQPLLPNSAAGAAFIGDSCLNSDTMTTMLVPTVCINNTNTHRGTYEPELNVSEFPRHKLRLVEKLGEGGFGMVHLCEIDNLNFSDGTKTFQSFNELRKIVVVRSMWKGTSKQEKNTFTTLVKRLATLRDVNVAQVVAVCTQDEPLCLLTEFSEYGDLYQFLRSHAPTQLNNNNNISHSSGSSGSKGHYSNASDLVLLHGTSPNTSMTSSVSSTTSLSASTLSYIATQIASGMKYLESQGFVHRDLAARNCLIGGSYQVKISDTAIYRPVYSSDYHRVPESSDDDVLALRWIPWEVYVMRLWSTKSDVWSFGVTLWELFTFCSEKPLVDLTDDQVEENLKHWFHSDGFHLLPTRPPTSTCSKEMFDLMLQCWSREPEDRPRFAEIQQFLQNKCIGFSVD